MGRGRPEGPGEGDGSLDDRFPLTPPPGPSRMFPTWTIHNCQTREHPGLTGRGRMPLQRWSYLSVVASAVNLLSINSHVAYGHVGNAAAVFALQRLGCEVWPVHTALFSNHAGHGSFRGEMVEASAVGDLVRGIEERGVLARCDGVLSGYLGRTETGEAILEAFAK